MRLSQRQRMVLEVLAHMRVPREQAWSATGRLAWLTGNNWYATRDSLARLRVRGLVERGPVGLWRITDAGREAL